MNDPNDDLEQIQAELNQLPDPSRGSFIDDEDYYNTFPEDEAYDKIGNDDPDFPFGW